MSVTKLRDGTTTRNPKLDLIFDYDVRNRMFGMSHSPDLKPINRLWGLDQWFDQGNEGACAGFAAAHALLCEPATTRTNQKQAFAYYESGKRHDHIEGEDYSGTTLLGVAKGLRDEFQLIDGWRWCFGLRDVIMTVGHSGPVILGLSWTEGMMSPSPDGLIKPTGRIVGGHGTLLQGVNVDYQYGTIHQSWGRDHGHGGNVYISFEDLEYLLLQGGQAMFLEEKAV